MLVEMAIGDAYGAGFEFAPMKKVSSHNNLSKYLESEFGAKIGCYTDDTQMSLAIAELMVSDASWSKINLANKFVECFKRDERPGYARGFYRFLKSIPNGESFLNKIKPDSTRNGAAMRSAPLGYIKDLDQLLEMADLQASLTHNTDIGRKSSQAVALASHYVLYQLGSKENLKEFVCQYSGYNWQNDWQKPVACCGKETVNALLTVLKNSQSLSEILLSSVAFSGDVDTVAALGLAIASLSLEYQNDLPEFLYSDLENGNYGKDYLSELTSQLHKLKKSQ